MIKIGECWLDPKRISSMEWERTGLYVNGPGESRLVITMENATRHIVHHQPHMLGGIDCYKLEKEILEALK